MRRVSLAERGVDPGNGKLQFQDKDLLAGMVGTILAGAMHTVWQEELCALVEELGGTLDATGAEKQQILTALQDTFATIVALAAEAKARADADTAEESARATADSDEAAARADEDTALQTEISAIQWGQRNLHLMGPGNDTSGSFECPITGTYRIIGQAAGGGGGDGNGAAGGGGASGQYDDGFYALSAGTVLTIQCGLGGTANLSGSPVVVSNPAGQFIVLQGGAPGGAGEDKTYGSGGVASTAAPGGTGDLQAGANGQAGISINVYGASGVCIGGQGASSPLGAGGTGGIAPYAGNAFTGNPGSGHGAGGGGGVNGGAGGAGAPGIVKILW